MKQFVVYLLWPNPGNLSYASPKVQVLLAACAVLIVLSFALRFWRRGMQNPVTKRLSRSWPSAAFWFGITGLVMTVSRVEMVSFLAMRLLWVIWLLILGLYLFIQVRIFRVRHYQPLPREHSEDPRDKYLPHKKPR